MRENLPPPTLAEPRKTSCWWGVCCENVACLHHAPIALVPLIIRWGPDASMDVLRRSARCSRCGRKGAAIMHPGWGGSHVGTSPRPLSRGESTTSECVRTHYR
jgi:hypothetical protein